MTRARIAEGLELVALQLANGETYSPPGWEAIEWTTVKGIAAAAVWNMYARLVTLGKEGKGSDG